MVKQKVLVVDDEEYITEIIKINLEDKFDVMCCYNGTDVIDMAEDYNPDIILLDIMLPGADGFQVCSIIREDEKTRKIPIIMLTVKRDESDKIKGLRLGADDYITKPFSINELIARIEAVLRRSHKELDEIYDSNIIKIGNIAINNENYEVTKNNEHIDITLREFKLLQTLAKKRGEVVPREVLLREVWGSSEFSDSRTLDVHIRKLRKKIEHNDKFPEYIETIRGTGYKMK